ncbi:MAG: ABC transporter permease, partial [Blastomonas sp.]|nr:ABC transporter permease [Blastomonas sp.]
MRWVNLHLNRGQRTLLGLLPIVLLLLVYLVIAAQRHADNPLDRILPLPDAMVRAMAALMFQADQLTGQYTFWVDTLASLQRLGLGLGIATITALVVGLVL